MFVDTQMNSKVGNLSLANAEAADTREGPVGFRSAEQVQQPWLQTGGQSE
ncbi:MAG: hypothetical protein AB7H48_03065 [Parachlamydiales bacterium]